MLYIFFFFFFGGGGDKSPRLSHVVVLTYIIMINATFERLEA